MTYLFIIASLFTPVKFEANETTNGLNTVVAEMIEVDGTDYTIIRCYITKRNNRTLSHFEIDLGSDESHPLKKRLINGSDDLLIGTTADNKQVTITSEVDALKFMSDDGWALVSANQLNILDKDNMQYLFSRPRK